MEVMISTTGSCLICQKNNVLNNSKVSHDLSGVLDCASIYLYV